MRKGVVTRVSGPVVTGEGLNAKIADQVRVGDENLIGEVISIEGDLATIQVYEETDGLGVGDPILTTDRPMSVELGPGLIGAIYDGVQRPLDLISRASGDFMARGIELPGLDRKKKWGFKPVLNVGAQVSEGDVLGVIQETPLVEHRVLVPCGVRGKIVDLADGKLTVEDRVASVKTASSSTDVKLFSTWPVRMGRPYQEKLDPDTPLITGQRVLDTFFPIAKGGTACVPGPFGSGKTVIQHQLAKWADADIIVFIGCGERGNEMSEVLLEFPQLKDPRSGRSLMERTVLIANTSNMPFAAREASVHTVTVFTV